MTFPSILSALGYDNFRAAPAPNCYRVSIWIAKVWRDFDFASLAEANALSHADWAARIAGS